MKKQRHIQTTRTLLSRFRYWGRKNYAAFASMGREFQIGHLHTNVVDVALRKQNAAQTIPYHTFMTLQEIKDQVLAGIDISPDQAAWLANMADSEALYAAAHEIKNAKLMWPVRIAVAGKAVTPGGAVEICQILGKEESLRRIRIGIEKLSQC